MNYLFSSFRSEVVQPDQESWPQGCNTRDPLYYSRNQPSLRPMPTHTIGSHAFWNHNRRRTLPIQSAYSPRHFVHWFWPRPSHYRQKNALQRSSLPPSVSMKAIWKTLVEWYSLTYIGINNLIFTDQRSQVYNQFIQIAVDADVDVERIRIEAQNCLGVAERYHGPFA